jgi:predicted DNA-binding transcriptional regulator AlpA
MKAPRWTNRRNVRKRYNNISDSSLSRWIKAGVFPPPETIGKNTFLWNENVLDEYDADPEGWKSTQQAKEIASDSK